MSNNGITVTATGAASGPPDRAVLTLGASAVRGEVAAALAVVNGKIESLISTLAGHGIEGPDIQTSDLVDMARAQQRGRRRRLSGQEHGARSARPGWTPWER